MIRIIKKTAIFMTCQKAIKIITIALLFFEGITVSAQEYRDVIYMKNGSVIKGFYKELYPGDSLHMETIDGGLFICAVSDIERIAKERKDVYLIKRQPEIVNAEWYKNGYRAYIEYGSWMNLDDTRAHATSFVTSHGYAFGKVVFIGGGFGVDRISLDNNSTVITKSEINLPIFANLRVNILKRRLSPFVDLKAGYTVLGVKGGYGSFSSGLEFNITPRFGLILSLGYYFMNIEDVAYRSDSNKANTSNAFFRLGVHL